MDPFDRSRSISSRPNQPPASTSARSDVSRGPNPSDLPIVDEKGDVNVSNLMKGPKRKRLAKACDACHKSKRRCDGTAPCSNCYFASKTCSYTDSTGRPVPAPRPFKADAAAPHAAGREPAYHTFPLDHFNLSRPHSEDARLTYGLPPSPSPRFMQGHVEDDVGPSRKRSRQEGGPDPATMETGPNVPRPSGLDPALIRELVNLFFAHCHPHRIIFHKPSFSSSLSHNSIPSYLLHAVCALAAPLSKQSRIRTSPSRLAGRYFAQGALASMFDTSGRLVCESNLATAQALCLLQMHEFVSKPSWSMRYNDLALQIIESLDVHKPDNPIHSPTVSPKFIQGSVERECTRRVFWLLHLTDLMSNIYFKRSMTLKDNELLLRLPVDETSFELAVHSTLPEYLYLQAPRTTYASEFGHLIRALSIYSKVERVLDASTGSDSEVPTILVTESQQALDSWMLSLPDHLQFSEESLPVQLSMFETSSNTGAWCFCCMHVIHASCELALTLTRQHGQRGSMLGPQWAIERLETILSALGTRAKNSFIMGAALWSLLKYCNRETPQVRTWTAEYEELWGFRVQDLIFTEWDQPQPQQSPHRFSLSSMPIPIPIPISVDRNGYDRSLSDSGSASSFPSLGRSLNELRLHGRQTADQRPFSDPDMDSLLIDGAKGAPSDGPQSLPSLKSSGLLDSWNSGKEVGASPWTTRSDGQLLGSPSRMSSKPSSAPDLDSSRASTSGMPVGMPWLANESR